MFIGREKEKKLIQETLSKTSTSVMVYGKRKVGKTTLLIQSLKDSKNPTIYYECLKSSLKENIDGLVNELVNHNILPTFLSFDTFQNVFQYLNTLNQTINIIIDEYPYLKEFTDHKLVDSTFQTIIDNHLKNIRLFLSGSHIGMMKDLLEEKNALYGRFDLIIQLEEFDYLTASSFYPSLSAYDKIANYAVFGGSPYINHFLQEDKSISYNIIHTILNEFSPVYSYADNLLLSDFTNSIGAQRILSAIANGKKKYKEIEDQLQLNKTGLLSKQLNPLLSMNLIKKTYPINKQNDSKKCYYEINDNLLRFYYSYIHKNKSALEVLGSEAFYNTYIEPTIHFYISKRFEEICRTYFSLQVKQGNITGVYNIGTYYYDDSLHKTNGEFDVVLQRENAYDFYEVKFLKTKMKQSDIKKEVEQINSIQHLPIGNIGFISINGFEKNNSKYHLIDGKMLFKK